MRLIGMVEFVLEQSEIRRCTIEFKGLVTNYAAFLKQPLKLEMFVPCDDEGNVLEEPKRLYYDSMTGWNCPQDSIDYEDKMRPYEQAKEKVLFEGFYCENAQWTDEYVLELNNNKNDCYLSFNVRENEFETSDEESIYSVEYLVKYNITLTETAIKQIGL